MHRVIYLAAFGSQGQGAESNVLNNVNFLPPEGAAAEFPRPQFGTITDAERARIIQFGLKLHF